MPFSKLFQSWPLEYERTSNSQDRPKGAEANASESILSTKPFDRASFTNESGSSILENVAKMLQVLECHIECYVASPNLFPPTPLSTD